MQEVACLTSHVGSSWTSLVSALSVSQPTSLFDEPNMYAPALAQVDNKGLMSCLYEAKLTSGEKVAGSLQLQATDLSQPVKYGFAVDLS